MILITGAAGKTGRVVIQALSEQVESLRAFVRGSEQMGALEELGVNDVIVGDLRSTSDLDRAFAGVRAVYHIPPNVSPDEVTIGENMIRCARSAEVEQFVFHSVLHPQSESMPHHWNKLKIEELLLESELPFSILQPAAYMQNILSKWNQIFEMGIFPVPYPVETSLSLVDLEDVAKAAAITLTETAHVGATYELVGTPAMTQTDIATNLSQELGRPVQAEQVPLDTWRREARSGGLGEYQIETLVKMFRYYEHYDFWGSPQVLSWLLDRSPTSLGGFIKRVVHLHSRKEIRTVSS